MGFDWDEWRGDSYYPDDEKDTDLKSAMTLLDRCRLYADMYYLMTGDKEAHKAVLGAISLLKPRKWRKNPVGA